jgi:hypothetical protein
VIIEGSFVTVQADPPAEIVAVGSAFALLVFQLAIQDSFDEAVAFFTVHDERVVHFFKRRNDVFVRCEVLLVLIGVDDNCPFFCALDSFS